MASSSSFLELLLAVSLLLLVGSATAASQRCDLSSIQVQQTNTGKRVGYDPVFLVEVKNLCPCAVTSVFLRSEGFSSSVAVDPKLFRREADGYIVNDGKAIGASLSVSFRYAWDRAFHMSASSFHAENCSCSEQWKMVH